MAAVQAISRPFGTLGALVRAHALEAPRRIALSHGGRRVSYAELDVSMDRIAAALRRDGIGAGERIALCGVNSIEYALLFLGALRAGVVCALVPPGVTGAARAAMVADANARQFFDDARLAALGDWMGTPGAVLEEPDIRPGSAFNIIYSSGTTGAPKGIVQPHSMRWAHMQRGPTYHYDGDSVTLLATPLYSNTTLVSFFPTLAMGGTVLMMGKFDAAAYLALAQAERATHTMLVPVQYQRIMALPGFDAHDLSSFRMKLSTSAPFPAALKRDVIGRWPGELVEYYGMTEGGATCVLWCNRHPDKLDTVGRPAAGVEVRLVDEEGREVPQGHAGEVVGHSGAMMTGYHNRPADTAEAEWFDGAGRRYIRTGDIGRFDEDGFLTLVGRRKDMIISGGFNVYPSDIEAVLRAHEAVLDATVVGMPSQRWGESPVAFVVAKAGTAPSTLLDWANQRLGKVQRLAALELVAELPRSAIGKVLKRELREAWQGRLQL